MAPAPAPPLRLPVGSPREHALKGPRAAGLRFTSLRAEEVRSAEALRRSVSLPAGGGTQSGATPSGSRIVAGEFDWSATRVLSPPVPRAGGSPRPIVLLRDPILRALSQYNHHLRKGRLASASEDDIRRLMDPAHCSQLAAGDAPCDRLANPARCAGSGWCGVFQNAQAEALAGAAFWDASEREGARRSYASLQCAAERNLRRAAFVAVAEGMEASVCLLLDAFGWAPSLLRSCCTHGPAEGPQCSLLRARTNTLAGHLQSGRPSAAARAPPSPAVLRSVLAGNRVDCALYTTGTELLARSLALSKSGPAIRSWAELPGPSERCTGPAGRRLSAAQPRAAQTPRARGAAAPPDAASSRADEHGAAPRAGAQGPSACTGRLELLRRASRPRAHDVPLASALLGRSRLDAGVCVRDGRDVFACLPSVILVGVMKGGTTEFARYASLHPQIAASTREAHFFNCKNGTGLAGSTPGHTEPYRCDAERRPGPGAWWAYAKRHFAGTRRVGFEKTPNYMWTPTTAGNIRQLLPSAIVLVLLREPGARAYSHFGHSCAKRTAGDCTRHAFDAVLWPAASPVANASWGGGHASAWAGVAPNSYLLRGLYYLAQLQRFWDAGYWLQLRRHVGERR